MSKYTKAPAEGDRIDLGGKVPQFKAFAHFVYQEMVRGNLAWVRIADIEAKKIDDIQFATHAEIHAYQMKWSNQEKLPAFTFLNFMELLPEMIEGWTALKLVHANEHKKIFVHMISNRPPSVSDEVKDSNGNAAGTFQEFYTQLLQPLQSGRGVTYKWAKVLLKLIKETGLSRNKFYDFLDAFVLNITFEMPVIGKIKPEDKQKDSDFNQLYQFIIAEVADNKKTIHFSVEKLIQELGWESRFKTTFQHEFVVDKQKYQPITATLDQLNRQVAELPTGYIFLNGNPGSGKSTLLTQWAKNSTERVIRYYAFSNISQAQNHSQRGESKNLFFDLVIQLNQQGVVSTKTVLPYHDDLFLRQVFFEQLSELGANYQETGRKTVIIVDGLDHIPREYHTINSLLSNLPAPAALPAGILFILGSQTFELPGLQPDVRVVWQKGKSNLQIAFMEKKSVFKYIDQYGVGIIFTGDQKDEIFRLSKGHPLQLTYLLAEIAANTDSLEQILAREDFYHEDIENYYQKIWDTIDTDVDIKRFLGLFARISGEINLAFVKEWGFTDQVYRSFRQRAIHLFSNRDNRLVFFHNSFRQFIIRQTATDELTGQHDEALEAGYHYSLANYYMNSTAEYGWNRNYHLYKSQQYDQFLIEATTEHFIEQLLAYRPVEKIRQDMQLGVRIASIKKSDVILVRYLFMITELNSRINNFDPGSFVKEQLNLGNLEVAKKYLRDDHILNTSKKFALSSCQDLYYYGDKTEAKLIYSLAEPNEIHESSILVEPDTRYEHTVSELEEWASAAVLFDDLDQVLEKIEHTAYIAEASFVSKNDNAEKLKSRLCFYVAVTLVRIDRWSDFDLILERFDFKDPYQADMLITLLIFAAKEEFRVLKTGVPEKYLPMLIAKFKPEDATEENKIRIADAVYKLTRDLPSVKVWLKGVKQPKIRNNDFSENYSLRSFSSRIKLNKLLYLTGQGQTIFQAVPDAQSITDNTLVEFERMLCLISSLLADGLSGKTEMRIVQRIKPLVSFYYRKIPMNDPYRYTIKRLRKEYFDFLIDAVSKHGTDALLKVKDYLLTEFDESSIEWPVDSWSEVLFSLIHFGIEKDDLSPKIEKAEEEILEGHDSAGRIEQCQQQVKAWMELNEFTKAERWMKQTLREALSIGYRKDYQLNIWMDWLERANVDEPGKGNDRIAQILSRLQYVKDVTEHKPFWLAAEKILNITYRWNFSAGVGAQQYLIEKGLIHFEDGIEVFIRGVLYRAKANELPLLIDLFLELLLANADESRSHLLAEILSVLAKTKDEKLIKEGLRRLVEGIRIVSLDVYRLEYFREIVKCPELKAFDLSTLHLPDTSAGEEEDSNSNRLTLTPDYKAISEKEVIGRVIDYQSFKAVVLQEDQLNSSFNWHAVFEKLGSELTKQQIVELAEIVGRRRKESRFYDELSRKALLIGDIPLAKKMAEQAIASSSSSGWDKYYDGGSRLNGFIALIEAVPETGYDHAFDTFCDDILSTEYTTTYAEAIKEVLPVISKMTTVKDIYPEVERHIGNLLANATPDPDAALALKSDDRPFNIAMLEFLVYLSHFPASVYRKSALRFLATNLELFPIVELKKLTVSTEQNQELFIDLMVLNRLNEQLLAEFNDELLLLSDSKNYFIANYALMMLYLLNPDFEPKERAEVKLSAVYNMDMSRVAKGKKLPLLNPEDFVEETDDVEILTRAVDYWVSYIAEVTAFNRINIRHRIYSVMKDIAKPYEWSAKREQEIRGRLEALDIKSSFTRPRVDIVRRAVLYVMQELMDGGFGFNLDDLQMMEFKDPDTLLIPRFQKPDYIDIGLEKHGGKKDWLAKLSSHDRLKEGLIISREGWTVIGEYYILKKLDWDFPTEVYQSQLKFKNGKDSSDRGDWIFGALFQRLVMDAAEPERWPHFKYIIALNDNRFFSRDIRATWIAFNAELAYRLGWIPHDTLPFAWTDSSGELMVESVYWEDGNIHLNSRVSDAHTGEGWFVHIADKGFAALNLLKSDLLLEKQIARSYAENGLLTKETVENVILIEMDK